MIEATVASTSSARPADEAATPKIPPDRERRYWASRGLVSTDFLIDLRAAGTSAWSMTGP